MDRTLPTKLEKRSQRSSKIYEPQATCLCPLEQTTLFRKET